MSPAERGASQAQAIVAKIRAETDALLDSLTADVAAGLCVLRTRDGVAITEAQVAERAANIVAALVGNYRIEPLTGVRYAYPASNEAMEAHARRIIR